MSRKPIIRRFSRLFGGLMLASALATGASAQQAGMSGEQLYKTDCAECHMAFQAEFLPQRSWNTILQTLDNHFGEDASMDPAAMEAIRAYLNGNAADAGGRRGWAMRGVGDGVYILRITEMPWWQREHRGEVSNAAWTRAGSKANCTACHRGAERGYYDDD